MKTKTAFRFFIFSCVLAIFATTQPAYSMSCRRWNPEDPNTKRKIAVDKYSPFEPMIWGSFAGGLATVVAFAPKESSPDHDRKSIKTIGSIAVFSYAISGSVALMSSGCSIPDDVKEKVGPVTKADADPEMLLNRRRGFLFFYSLNTLPTLLYAIESKRDERWAVFGAVAVLPALVDLTSRYVLRSHDVSPWTLTSTFVGGDDEHSPTPILALRTSW